MGLCRPTAVLLLTLLLFSPSAVTWAAGGVVVNEKQEPIVGARVCHFIDNIEIYCGLTDSMGRFELPASEGDTLRAVAEGYNPETFSAAGHQGPIVLRPAPALTIRLIDESSGEGIEKGEVRISYPSGKELGPFPTNRAGLRIRRGLQAGEIRIVGEAAGYRSSDPVAVTLEAGRESDVSIKLVAEPTKKPE